TLISLGGQPVDFFSPAADPYLGYHPPASWSSRTTRSRPSTSLLTRYWSAPAASKQANDPEELPFGVLPLLIPVGRKADLLANRELVRCSAPRHETRRFGYCLCKHHTLRIANAGGSARVPRNRRERLISRPSAPDGSLPTMFKPTPCSRRRSVR